MTECCGFGHLQRRFALDVTRAGSEVDVTEVKVAVVAVKAGVILEDVDCDVAT